VRVGLYGGTFDPIHNGHIHVIKELITQKIVDHLLVIPAGQPLLREKSPAATGSQRRTMCQLAINELPSDIKSHVEVNPIEILRDGPSYTIDTVEAVEQSFAGDAIVLIVGTDAYQKIDDVWTDVWSLRDMTDEEKITRQQSAKDIWKSFPHRENFTTWIFDEEICGYVPPIPKPTDEPLEGQMYRWQGSSNSWALAPTIPDDGKIYEWNSLIWNWEEVVLKDNP
jgi:nicotinate-nucleotide adenylyltransferase